MHTVFFGGALSGLLRSEHTQVDTISFRIHGKGGGVRFYRSPIQIGVIPFEFRISQAFKTFAGDSIVVVFLPDTVVGAWNTVFPYTVRTASQPAHSFGFLLGIRECKSQLIDFLIEEFAFIFATVTTVQHKSVHTQQTVGRHTPDYGI